MRYFIKVPLLGCTYWLADYDPKGKIKTSLSVNWRHRAEFADKAAAEKALKFVKKYHPGAVIHQLK